MSEDSSEYVSADGPEFKKGEQERGSNGCSARLGNISNLVKQVYRQLTVTCTPVQLAT